MKTTEHFRFKIVWLLLVALIFAWAVVPAKLLAQDEEALFSREELTQMLAPIALYPDSLIAQILMAATYPLDVVEAERWLRGNSNLTGDDLYDALRDQPWDPSVKSLCNFPDVLFAMSEKLDQTRRLGEAFLRQEQEVMDTIQELRWKARDYGTLSSTGEQKVIVEREIIRIEPASPRVVYVPVYDPYYVYGPWWYPAYPPYYWYYPPRPYASRISIYFGPRVFFATGLFSWVWFDWYVHRIHIEAPVVYRFHRYPARPPQDRYQWRHDPKHRRSLDLRERKSPERSLTPAPRPSQPLPERRDDLREKKTEPARSPVQPTAPVIKERSDRQPEAERREQKSREPEKAPELRQDQGQKQPPAEARPKTGTEGKLERRPAERSPQPGMDRKEPEKSQAKPPRQAAPPVKEKGAEPPQTREKREPKAREPEKIPEARPESRSGQPQPRESAGTGRRQPERREDGRRPQQSGEKEEKKEQEEENREKSEGQRPGR